MASVGTEVSVVSIIYAKLALLSNCFPGLGKCFLTLAASNPLVNEQIIGVGVSRCRKLAAASPQSLAFVLDRRAVECAGRCCAPEPELSVGSYGGL